MGYVGGKTNWLKMRRLSHFETLRLFLINRVNRRESS